MNFINLVVVYKVHIVQNVLHSIKGLFVVYLYIV